MVIHKCMNRFRTVAYDHIELESSIDCQYYDQFHVATKKQWINLGKLLRLQITFSRRVISAHRDSLQQWITVRDRPRLSLQLSICC